MGGVNSSTARAWRIEFKRSGIGEKELIFIRENLSKLEKPEYVPNSLTLIAILKKEVVKGCRTILGGGKTECLNKKQISALRETTSHIRNTEMDKIRAML